MFEIRRTITPSITRLYLEERGSATYEESILKNVLSSSLEIIVLCWNINHLNHLDLEMNMFFNTLVFCIQNYFDDGNRNINTLVIHKMKTNLIEILEVVAHFEGTLRIFEGSLAKIARSSRRSPISCPTVRDLPRASLTTSSTKTNLQKKNSSYLYTSINVLMLSSCRFLQRIFGHNMRKCRIVD